MEDYWELDRRVLEVVVSGAATALRPPHVWAVAAQLGAPIEDVGWSFQRLGSGAPPYLVLESGDFDTEYPTEVRAVTERALRESGAWPTAERFAQDLLAALTASVEAESDPEAQSKGRQALQWLGASGWGVLMAVAGRALGNAAGM